MAFLSSKALVPFTAVLFGLWAACGQRPHEPLTTSEEPVLKDVFKEAFLVGAAMNEEQFTDPTSRGADLVREHFNSITAENVLKWESVHPEPGRYDFQAADRFVAFGEEHRLVIIGHTLIWHSQTPGWVFQNEHGGRVGRDTLLARMRDHILTVVGRYRGRIAGWDVVNEPLDEDGTLRQSPWRQIIGEDYIAKAFEFAREADPDAGLYVNDYSLPNEPKRNGAVALVRKLQDEGIPVTGIGLQGHYTLSWPSVQRLDSTLSAFSRLGIDVMVTELDIDVLPRAIRDQGADVSRRAELRDELNPYAEALPDSVQQVLAGRYADLFRVFLDYQDIVTRVTFWGVTDADSWKNNWPVPGRTNYPLLFDREGEPKPAFRAVIEAAH